MKGIKFFTETFNNQSFNLLTLRNISFFNCTFTDCVFMYTAIDRCKFINCKFINCYIDKAVLLNSVVQIKKSSFVGKCVTDNQNLLKEYPNNFTPHASIGIHCKNTNNKQGLTCNNKGRRNKKPLQPSRKKY